MRLSALACLLSVVFLADPGFAAEVETAPRRIVSIGGAVTEILYGLGQGDRVVAVDTTSIYPPEALAGKPNVGYMRALSAEGVLSLAPDLVLMDEGAGPREAVALLDASGVAVKHVPTGHSAKELHDKVVQVAAAVGEDEAGKAMAARIDADFAGLERELAGMSTPKRRVLFILSLVDGRPNAAGSDTGADAVIRLAGAENVFGDVKGYKALSTEALAALKPDVILVVDRAGPGRVDPMAVPALAATPAGEKGAVIRMDAAYLLGFGPRTPAAVRDLAARLYPDAKIQASGAR